VVIVLGVDHQSEHEMGKMRWMSQQEPPHAQDTTMALLVAACLPFRLFARLAYRVWRVESYCMMVLTGVRVYAFPRDPQV